MLSHHTLLKREGDRLSSFALPYFSAVLIEGMIFSEKVRGTHLLRKNHPWILQPLFFRCVWNVLQPTCMELHPSITSRYSLKPPQSKIFKKELVLAQRGKAIENERVNFCVGGFPESVC
jgi:hypothetical protein